MLCFASRSCVKTRSQLCDFFVSPFTSNVSFWAKFLNYNQKRNLSLHEYQSLNLLRKYGVKVPKTCVAYTVDEVEKCLQKVGSGQDYVLKAQVLAGGRGLGYFKKSNLKSGIHICSSVGEVKEIAKKMLGDRLITKQTGLAGRPCNAVLISERFYIRSEKYIAILIDRLCGGMVIIGSAKGGSSIESIAEKHPESVFKMNVDIKVGIKSEEAREFAQKLGFVGERKIEEATECLKGLCDLFIARDCTLLEINPFAETHDGSIVVCDAKINFDDNAEYRQKEIFSMRDEKQEDEREMLAHRWGLNYVGLEGDIGCMVNGAGLAMATMDIIKLYGGNPANFLDVGGGANKSQVVEALRILQNDKNVNVVLTNIFGGIMRCDTIALGIIHASQEVGLTKPLVVRLQGTKQDIAKDILDNSGLRMLFCNDFEDAAQKAVKMTQILSLAKTAELDVSFAM